MRFRLLFIVLVAFTSVCAKLEGAFVDNVSVGGIEYCSNDVPVDIVDNQTITSSLTITDIGDIADLNVKINIEHKWVSDLIVSLVGPDGTSVELFSNVGRDEGAFNDTILDYEASQSIKSGSSPFEGTYKPEGNLSNFYDKSMTGTWTIQVTDNADPDSGVLNSWSLIIEKKPYEPMTPPVIHSESSISGGICDTVVWEMTNNTIREYHSEYGGGIPSYGNETFNIYIDDPNIIEDINVKLNIKHVYTSELQVFLVSPDMIRIELFSGVGDSSDNFTNTILDSDAALSISEGTGPFTGTFHPEGNLDALIGKNIRGTWALEITDNGFENKGSVESWSLIAELTNVIYCAQCAANSSFSNIVQESGWIVGNSYTFTDLDPQQKYWYRVKVRPNMRWFQTTRSDFKTDTLTDVITTRDCNVELPVADSSESDTMEVHVIDDPSFETGGDWRINCLSNVQVGAYSRDNNWASDGNWSLGVSFNHSYLCFYDDYAQIFQTVDWTGVDTLMFDYGYYGYGNLTLVSVEIGGIVAWYEFGTEALDSVHANFNETIDVSSINGPKELNLKVASDFFGWFDAWVFWDNLRTYRTIPQEVLPGSVISTPVSINDDQTWDILDYSATIPAETALTVDILPENGTNSIPGYSDMLSGMDLSGLSQKTIRLRANLSTNQRHITPELHDWSVFYKNPALESGWSNVVSSQCN
ncbi:MAG: proprotein convertase P-domain-containing protein [Sedimentisphaerales bacterium]|nr:proprotein convertase P-domain-containing protein [Sedimentisphaerales bacterium]